MTIQHLVGGFAEGAGRYPAPQQPIDVQLLHTVQDLKVLAGHGGGRRRWWYTPAHREDHTEQHRCGEEHGVSRSDCRDEYSCHWGAHEQGCAVD